MAELGEEKNGRRTSVELFAGGGGLAQAVELAGFRPLLVNEHAKRACETLEANDYRRLPEGVKPEPPEEGERCPMIAGDVQKVDFDRFENKVDLLAGGPPCQPFSLGGVARGDEDKRNMFPELFRAIREIRPKAVICENVRGLLRPSFRPYFNYIQRELEFPFLRREEGSDWKDHFSALEKAHALNDIDPHERYRVVMTPVNAADYGVPQIRNRVILVAFRADLQVDIDAFRKSVEEPEPATWYSEKALIRSMMLGEYWDRHKDANIPPDVRARVEARLPKELPEDDGRMPWRTLRDALRGIREGEGQLPFVPLHEQDRTKEHGGVAYHVGWPNARKYDGHTPNELDRPAKTVKAGVHGVPGGESVMELDQRVPVEGKPGEWEYQHRYMTVRETARVMTFPDGWKLEGPRGEKMRQLGNAVPVMLGEFFANAVARALDAAPGDK
ncbi:DNA cytosine methyltransferase [Streptomyces sp. NPDC046631]|uniref:DNA cytosine methyltransferase n=1 Tax=Streptomyces TaxID=1883 RepID=UPI0033C224D6